MDALEANPLTRGTSKWVLVVVEDVALAELIAEALFDAGHVAQLAEYDEVLGGEIECTTFNAAIVDLDTRSRAAGEVLERIRRESPETTLIALLRCGGQPASDARPHYHLAIEKPARLKALLTAVAAARDVNP